LQRLSNNNRAGARRLMSVSAGVAVLAAAGLAATFVSCGSKKGGSSSPKPQPQFPEAPTATTGQAPVQAVGLDGTWQFARFECTKGELTPWAKVENDLVDVNGIGASNVKWSTESDSAATDNGVIKRSHIWQISGDGASRESRLEFFSSRASQTDSGAAAPAAAEATAWAATKKAYTLDRKTDGKLVLIHGKLEGPFFKGLPLEPVNVIIDQKLDEAKAKGRGWEAVVTPIQNMKNFLMTRINNSKWIQSLVSFANDVTEATETVNYTVDASTLKLSGARITIKGAPTNPGPRLVDVTICGGLNGEATRVYTRVPAK
jgi:hypothetical protein